MCSIDDSTFVEAPGAGHEWSLWSQNLADMAQLVFRDVGKQVTVTRRG